MLIFNCWSVRARSGKSQAFHVFMQLGCSDWKVYCSPYFTVKAYKKTYKGSITPILHETDWDEPTTIVMPPIRPRKPGRPTVNRKRGADEGPAPVGKIEHRCSKCKGWGHNKTTCPGGGPEYEAYIAAASTAPRKKGATPKGGRPTTRPRVINYGVPLNENGDAFNENVGGFNGNGRATGVGRGRGQSNTNAAGRGRGNRTGRGNGAGRGRGQSNPNAAGSGRGNGVGRGKGTEAGRGKRNGTGACGGRGNSDKFRVFSTMESSNSTNSIQATDL
ncbi:hypothetical protein AQUCO_01900178v1 [Aquilegia coerulea]|uniref:Uncharacterized protein n=1 Tax=Aquilegia coerulea TaxID=218851 RepID=A0A2G5DJ83_AQUCA|nr:hypothetical protein AQUCO_01900178v1 [Aquilegia coerulea]